MTRIILISLFLITQTFGQKFWFFEASQPKTVYAVDLNGVDEWASVATPDSLDLGMESLTILAWVNTNDNSANQRIINYSGSGRYEMWFESSQLQIYVGDGISNYTTSVVTTPPNNQWILTACVIDQGSDSIRVHYVNGGILYSSVLATTLGAINPASTLYIGRFQSAVAFFDGKIGEIQFIRGKVLTRAEIVEQYNRGWGIRSFSSSYTGGRIVAWYKWEGSSDAEFLNDASASGNDLTGNNITQADDQVIINGGYK